MGTCADGTRPTDAFCREVMESCKPDSTLRLTRTLPNTRICPGAATPASNLAQRNSTKELEAHYKAQLDGLMKQRQERRWKARAELSARREARVEELRQEPGAEVPESEEDFRQRMQRNFLEGDTLQTKLAIVEEISKGQTHQMNLNSLIVDQSYKE